MKKLVFLSLLSVALLTSCGNGAQKDALKAQNDSLMVELSNRNAELDDIMGAFNEVQEGFRQINEAENRVDLQSGSIRENSADKIKEDIRFISEKLQSNREQIAKLEKQLKNSQYNSAQLKKAVANLTKELEAKQQQIVCEDGHRTPLQNFFCQLRTGGYNLLHCTRIRREITDVFLIAPGTKPANAPKHDTQENAFDQ